MEKQDKQKEEELKSLKAITKIVSQNPELFSDMNNVIRESHKKYIFKEKTKKAKK